MSQTKVKCYFCGQLSILHPRINNAWCLKIDCDICGKYLISNFVDLQALSENQKLKNALKDYINKNYKETNDRVKITVDVYKKNLKKLKKILKCKNNSTLNKSSIQYICEDDNNQLYALCGCMFEQYYMKITKNIYEEIKKHRETHQFCIQTDIDQYTSVELNGKELKIFDCDIRLEKSLL